MQELVSIEVAKIGEEEVWTVDARILHEWLEVRKPFAAWMKQNLRNFKKDRDYRVFYLEVKNQGGRPRTEYRLSIDTAKAIALMSQTRKGGEVREHFIQAEERLREIEAERAKKERQRIETRNEARLEYQPMSEALQLERAKQGKGTSYFHYSNEANLINKIALGYTAKAFKQEHNISENEPIRDHLTALQINCVLDLQRANTVFLKMGMLYEERKERLHFMLKRNHDEALTEEVRCLES